MPGSNFFTLLNTVAHTSSGSSPVIGGMSQSAFVVVQLIVTASSGTGRKLDVVIEDTVDGANFNTVAAFGQVTTALGRWVLRISTPFTNILRIRWTIVGVLPSFTFSVAIYAA